MFNSVSLKSILDGEILYQYLNLSKIEQADLAKVIGTSVERIIEDLLEIQIGIDVF
jgi:plasmid maintenance system antidote protein VapI